MSGLLKIFDRIEVKSLLSQHLATFYHYEKRNFYNKTEIPKSDKFIFLGLPLLIAVFFSFLGLRFTKDYVDIILTCLSIFTGLLFTLLAMILVSVQDNAKINIDNVDIENKKVIKAKIDLTKHLFVNIAFSIVLSIFALILVLSTQFHPIKLIDLIARLKVYYYLKNCYLFLTNGLSFFFLIEFLLTLFMIVRRFAVLYLNLTDVSQFPNTRSD
ncbi:hypothetical protein [Edaphocola flava]|uniref:hypothetical protein n=1 Tax=Edaphocola flava TaxID=2499629 RepID=UPI00100C360C|nr:hypothetical protein [Edaphocola flava]